MKQRTPWKVWATLTAGWVAVVLLGSIAGGASDGLDSIVGNFAAALFVSASIAVPIVGGIWTGQWSARASGRTWIGWAAGLATVVVLGLFFLQLQQALPWSMRYWIRRLG